MNSLPKNAPYCCAWRTIPFLRRCSVARFLWILPRLISPNPAALSPLSHTVHEDELRGCVGYILPTCSVFRAVAETARAAAFDDNRFPPVTQEEAPHLQIELSILSPAQPLAAEEIEVGRHGLLISWARPPRPAAAPGARRACLGSHNFPRANLPQSRTSPGRLAKRRDHRSLHRRSLRREKQWPVISGQ